MSSTVSITISNSRLTDVKMQHILHRVFKVTDRHCNAVARRGDDLKVIASSGQVIAFMIARDTAGFTNTFKDLNMQFVQVDQLRETYPSTVEVYNPDNRTEGTYDV